MLSIGFEEMNSGGVCPLKLNNDKIGEVTLGNKDANRVKYQITHIIINDEQKGNYYFPKFLEIIEKRAKSKGFKIMELFDVLPEKIESLKKRGYGNPQGNRDEGIGMTKKL